MKNSLKTKVLVIGIIVLFIGSSIVPTTVGKELLLDKPLLYDELDQENSHWDSHGYGSVNGLMAQSFKPTLNKLTRVELVVWTENNPTGNLTISIRESLYAVDLTLITISVEDLPHHIFPQVIWSEFDFPDIDVTPEHTYYIVSSHAPPNNNYTIFFGLTDSPEYYTRGELWVWYNQRWNPSDTEDLCFKTYGYTHENYPPNTPTITGKTNGTIQTSYDYYIQTTDPDQDDVKYQIDWGDNTTTTTGLNRTGKQIVISHRWDTEGTYNIKVKAIDEHAEESDWATLSVTIPCSSNKPIPQFLELLFQRFPNAFPLLRQLMGY